VTLTLSVEGRPFHLVVGVKEEDESWYYTFLPLDPVEGLRTVEIDFDWLRLDSNGEDENGVLDLDQVAELYIVDISGFIGPLGPGAVEVHSLAFWQGDADPPATQCVAEGGLAGDFLVGVDANYIPEGENKGTMWYVGETRVDPLALFAGQGVDSLRLRVWVGEKGLYSLDDAVELAGRAHGLGMQVYPVLFLSDDWVDVNKQFAPSEWADLSLDRRAEAVRTYAEETVSALLETSIQVPYYAVGNEIDYGISGVFAGVEQRDLATLQTTIWPQAAKLIRAAVEGIQLADPQARILLHVAQAYRPDFALAFYTAMQELGVDFDIAGLSYYPTAFGPLVVPGVCKTIDRLSSELGLQVVIAEFAYPGEVPTGGMFESWYNDLPGYPLTHNGQAAWLAAFLSSMRAHPAVIGAYYFSPAFHWSGELWGPFALFDAEGSARPAIGAFTLP
jgi:arabinogalactan endo-1,4-beta-galactosidase